MGGASPHNAPSNQTQHSFWDVLLLLKGRTRLAAAIFHKKLIADVSIVTRK